jgi:transcription elongation GreA/GreB family factor
MPREKVDKAALLAMLRADVEAALSAMEQAAATARDAAAHPEMQPENDKDTRALEAGYLASGQSARAAELRRSVNDLASLTPRTFGAEDRVDLTAIVDVDDDGKRSRYFIAPAGGGKKLTLGASTFQVITPSSPIGDALVGKRVGDVVEAVLGGKQRELEIVQIL